MANILKIQASAKTLYNLQGYEEASWEDHGRPSAGDMVYESRPAGGEKCEHPLTLLERYKSRIEVRSMAEAVALYWSMDNTADILGEGEGEVRVSTAHRIMSQLSVYMKENS